MKQTRRLEHSVLDSFRRTYLVGDSVQRPQESGHVHLTLGELTTARVVRAVERGRTVHNHQRISIHSSDNKYPL